MEANIFCTSETRVRKAISNLVVELKENGHVTAISIQQDDVVIPISGCTDFTYAYSAEDECPVVTLKIISPVIKMTKADS